jgi:hypothetical protein
MLPPDCNVGRYFSEEHLIGRGIGWMMGDHGIFLGSGTGTCVLLDFHLVRNRCLRHEPHHNVGRYFSEEHLIGRGIGWMLGDHGIFTIPNLAVVASGTKDFCLQMLRVLSRLSSFFSIPLAVVPKYNLFPGVKMERFV